MGGSKALTERLKANPEAVKCVYNTYYRLYWLPLCLDDITNDKLQYQMFDDAVNRGIVAAIIRPNPELRKYLNKEVNGNGRQFIYVTLVNNENYGIVALGTE